MQEFLVLVVIALAIFFIPRLVGGRPSPGQTRVPPPFHPPALTGRMRLAILITLFWITGSAALLEPWQEDTLPFLFFGLGPATILWGAVWVWFGYRKYRR